MSLKAFHIAFIIASAAMSVTCAILLLTIASDVTNDADVARLAATIREQWGGVDFLCHCAGRSMRGDVLDTSIDEFRQLWEINFLVQGFALRLEIQQQRWVPCCCSLPT